jgi:hypothetical protein
MLAALLIFGVMTRPSADRTGLRGWRGRNDGRVGDELPVRPAPPRVPGAISTAVMTGNLANAVLSAMDLFAVRQPLLPHDSTPLNRSLHRLLDFILGCVVATAVASLMGDWAWSLPVALAAVAIGVR